MAITYNAGTNTITVTGYTEGTPCNFTDIYNADVAGAWGVFTRQCTNQFCSTAFVQIGDGSTTTWFADEKKSIIFSDLGVSAREIRIKANGHFRSGKLLNDSRKSTSGGCFFHFRTAANHYGIWGDSGSDVVFYSTHLSTDTSGWTGVTGIDKIYNTYFDKVYLRSSAAEMWNVIFMNGTFAMYACAGNWDKIVIRDYSDSGITVSTNHHLSNVDQAGCGSIRAYYVTTDSSMTDCNIDTWHFQWISCTAKVYRKYSFDLKVIDKDNVAINGATVKIWDKDSNLVVDTTTNASGVIATQTIARGYYNQANGDTLQEASPHLIKIEKGGYTTYEADFTLEEKTDWLIVLQTSILRNPSMSGGMV